MWDRLQQALDNLYWRVTSMIKVGRVAVVDDTHANQVIQVQLGANQAIEVRKMGHYGLAYNPPVNSDAVVVALGGDPRNSYVLGTEYQDKRQRSLLPGEAMLWDDLGQTITLTRTGIVIDAAGNTVRIEGDTAVTGLVSSSQGYTGVFTTPTGGIVTVQQGIITSVEGG